MELAERKQTPRLREEPLKNGHTDGPSQCGSCWSATYNGRTIHILAVDHAGSGLNIAQHAMDNLTNGQAAYLGRVDAAVAPVDSSYCGL